MWGWGALGKSSKVTETRLQQTEVTDKSRGCPPNDFQGHIQASGRAHSAPAVTRKRLSSVTPVTNKAWTPGLCHQQSLLSTMVWLCHATCQVGIHGLHLTPIYSGDVGMGLGLRQT